MLHLRLLILVLAVCAPACVTRKVTERVATPKIFDLPPGILPASAHHGVSLFFETDLRPDPSDSSRVSSDELPQVADWINSTGERQLPPIIPDIAPGGREIYRVADLHRVEFYNSMFHVSGYHYLRMPRARLYVFKQREGNFSFGFRGQQVIVPSDRSWVPSVYYYSHEVETEKGIEIEKEVVQVGLASIETDTRRGVWFVNGKLYYPDPNRPLELMGAIHATGYR